VWKCVRYDYAYCGDMMEEKGSIQCRKWLSKEAFDHDFFGR